MEKKPNVQVNNISFSKNEGNIKAAIFYLVRSKPKDIADLKRSLSLLDVNFNNQFNYPVIVFHEDFTETLMEDIREATRSNLQFEIVKFEIPSFLNKDEVPEFVYAGDFGFPIGYRHMCRFMSSLVFQHPATKDYDYLWRLDTDSFILDTVDYDVFKFMHDNNYMYGYMYIEKDHPSVVEGLWGITKEYIKAHNIKPTFLHKFMSNGEWNRSYYNTNFEISNLDFWRSNEFLNYFNHLDRAGGIYKYRWGDHVIHLLAISMFMPENKVHKFSDIPYQHQSFVNNYIIDVGIESKMKNIKHKIMDPIWKLLRILKKRSKLYRTLLRLVWN